MPSRRPPISEITPGLYVGCCEASKDITTLMGHSITAMVSLGKRRAKEWDRPANGMLVPAENHLVVRCMDKPQQDILCKLPDICDFIEAHLTRKPPSLDEVLESPPENDAEDGLGALDVSKHGRKKNSVLVHCNMGRSRSATVVAAYLMRKRRKRRDEVLRFILKKRKVKPIRSFLDQLAVWEELDYYPWEDDAREVPKEPYRRWLETLKRKKRTAKRVRAERDKASGSEEEEEEEEEGSSSSTSVSADSVDVSDGKEKAA